MGLSTGIYLKRDGAALDDALAADVSAALRQGLVNVHPGNPIRVYEAIFAGVSFALVGNDPGGSPENEHFAFELSLLGTRDDELRVRLAKRVARSLEDAGFHVRVDDEALGFVDHRDE